jgi:arylsulfatase A-like enzyme
MTGADADRPNVLLVVCDTLRADALGCYGADTSTPNLDALADAGVRFEEAYAAGPGSSISHAALFSGQYPSETGVAGQMSLPPDVPVLAEWFRDAGYETFGIPGPARIGSDWGYDRGFDQYLEKWRDIPSSPTPADLKRALADPTLVEPMPRHVLRMARQGDDKHTGYLIDVLMRKLERDVGEPAFAFANYPFVHAPYDPPRPYKEAATPGDGLDRPAYGFMDPLPWFAETLDVPDVRAERVDAAMTGRGDPKFFEDPTWLSGAELDLLRAWYDASVRYLDAQLGRLFDWLRRTGRDERTVVVVVADHGEYLGEHGLLKHMYFHFEEALRVPMIVAGPGVPAGEVRTDPVSLIDVFATICDLTGVEAPDATTGRSVFGPERRDAVFMENGIRKLTEACYEHMSDARIDEFERGRKSVRTADHLFTVDSRGETHLYERPGDRPVDDPDAATVERLRERVRTVLGEEFHRFDGYGDDLDDAVEENLRELGYIG